MKRMAQSPGRSRRASGAIGSTWVALAFTLADPACTTSTAEAPSNCALNSDCAAGLICAFGTCRGQCVVAADCPTMGSSCIDDGRYPVCQSPTEKNTPCTRQADCPTPLACASDYRCRNLCESDADCNVLGIKGRACVRDAQNVDYCADPGEYANGKLDTKPPPNAPSTPVVEPEGGASAIVAALPSGDLIATNIGAGGGVVGVDGVTVTIPAGALSAPVAITIQRSGESGPAGTLGQVFEIGPTGTTFSQPVTIAFAYSDAELAGLAPSAFAVETISGGSILQWTPLSQIVVDVYAHTIAGQTTHLSPYALVQQVGGGTSADAAAMASYDSGGSGLPVGDAGSIPPEGGSIVNDAGLPSPPAIDAGPYGGADSGQPAPSPGLDAAAVMVGLPDAAL
jgi:hypothetical protein